MMRMRWVEIVASIREIRYAYDILFGKPEGKRQLVRPKHRWEIIGTLCWILSIV
jgi:hypothetical protein